MNLRHLFRGQHSTEKKLNHAIQTDNFFTLFIYLNIFARGPKFRKSKSLEKLMTIGQNESSLYINLQVAWRVCHSRYTSRWWELSSSLRCENIFEIFTEFSALQTDAYLVNPRLSVRIVRKERYRACVIAFVRWQ